MTSDLFTLRVRAAAVAGWWTVLVAAIFVALLWTGYRWLGCTHPAWVLRMWGGEMTWSEIQHIFLWVIVVFRLFVWILVTGVLWLTLWARQLKKRATAIGEVR